jgi:glycosyltransferase involved in cell wall biosynthesis
MKTTVAVCFTNFGPYHLARLRALARRLALNGSSLIAYEVAESEQTYPWRHNRSDQPFEWITLFPERTLETITAADCRRAILAALERDRPDAIGIVGYSRPESMAAARWARRRGRPAILMSESQAIDRPRVWWKELIKKRRLRWFDAALVGGPPHREYLLQLGMPPGRIALGYNAVDNEFFASEARFWRENARGRAGLPESPYFLTVCRFAPEKNLVRLIEAFACYRGQSDPSTAWDLVLCGDGPGATRVEDAIAHSGCQSAIHLPGFLQADALPRWYAFAQAFVLPSLSEPWGLVVNEAAASSLPLLVSDRAGCAPALVPNPRGTTGSRFDPFDIGKMARELAWMAALPLEQRHSMGRRAAEAVSHWGPDRFALGNMEAIELARMSARRRPHPSLATMKVS